MLACTVDELCTLASQIPIRSVLGEGQKEHRQEGLLLDPLTGGSDCSISAVVLIFFFFFFSFFLSFFFLEVSESNFLLPDVTS